MGDLISVCKLQHSAKHTQSPNAYRSVLPRGELFFLVLSIRRFHHKQQSSHFISLILNYSNIKLITFLRSFSLCNSLNLTLSLCGWASEDWTTESMLTPESVHLYLLSSTAKCHHHYDSTWQTADIHIFTLCKRFTEVDKISALLHILESYFLGNKVHEKLLASMNHTKWIHRNWWQEIYRISGPKGFRM